MSELNSVEYRVVDIVGPLCCTYKQGQVLCGRVHPALSEGCHVWLDFQGVTLTLSPFLGGMLVGLYRDYPPDVVRSSVEFINLPNTARDILVLVRKHLELCISDPEYEERVGQVLHRMYWEMSGDSD